MSIHEQPHKTIKRLESQLAAETIRAGEYQQERDRLRDAISRVEDWMHDDRAGMSALAAIIQDATGEAAIAPPQTLNRTDSLPCPQCNHAFCDCGEVGKAEGQNP